MDIVNYNNYKYFYCVVKYNGFSNASEKILISQPALSYSIKKLEDELGVKLLERSSRKISLTREGEELYKKLRKIENILNGDKKEMKEKISIGIVRVAADNAFYNVLQQFREKYPNILVEVIIEEHMALVSLFEKHKVNLVLNKYTFENNNSTANVFLNQFENCFACSKSFYENNKQMLSDISTFSSWPMVFPTKSKKRKLLDAYLTSLELTPNVVFEIPNSELLKKIVKNDNCVGYFTKLSIEDELKNGELVVVDNPLFNFPKDALYLIYDENLVDTPLEYMIDLIKENM